MVESMPDLVNELLGTMIVMAMLALTQFVSRSRSVGLDLEGSQNSRACAEIQQSSPASSSQWISRPRKCATGF